MSPLQESRPQLGIKPNWAVAFSWTDNVRLLHGGYVAQTLVQCTWIIQMFSFTFTCFWCVFVLWFGVDTCGAKFVHFTPIIVTFATKLNYLALEAHILCKPLYHRLYQYWRIIWTAYADGTLEQQINVWSKRNSASENKCSVLIEFYSSFLLYNQNIDWIKSIGLVTEETNKKFFFMPCILQFNLGEWHFSQTNEWMPTIRRLYVHYIVHEMNVLK